MSLYKLFLGIACMTIGYASAMQKDKRMISFQKKNIVEFSHNQWADQKHEKPAAFVQLIDKNGNIPKKTLGKMPIAHSRSLSAEYPKALENCCKGDNKNQILDVTEIMHAAPERWIVRFLPYLGLKSKQAKDKFESESLQTSLESYSMAERLHAGMFKKYTVEELFSNMSRNELKVADDLSNHFANGFTSKQVYRSEYDRIAALPKGLRQQFHNKKEFYTISLMRNITDQIVHVGIETAKGTVIGAGAGAIFSLGSDCGIDKVLIPAAQEYTINMLKKHAMFGVVQLMTGKAHQEGMQSAHETYLKIANDDEKPMSSLFVEVPKEYFKSAGETVINVEFFKKEFKPGKFTPTVIEHLKNGGTPMSEKNIQEALAKSIKAAQTGAVIGGVAGATYGLYTMNDPIVTKSISKI